MEISMAGRILAMSRWHPEFAMGDDYMQGVSKEAFESALKGSE